MKKLKYFIILTSIKLTAFVPAEFDVLKYPELAKFIVGYTCSNEIENQAKKEHSTNDGYYRYDNKFYLKHGSFHHNTESFRRIINARRLQNYVADKKLDKIGVPYKCWCKDRYEIVSRAVPYAQTDKKVSLHEVQQLAQFAKETGFSDWARDLEKWGKLGSRDANVRRNEVEKFMVIDTEDQSFGAHFCLYDHIRLLQLFLRNSMDLEAEQWLESRLEQLKNSSAGQEKPICFWQDSKYDDPGIDFEQVKKEFYKLEKFEQDKWRQQRKDEWRQKCKRRGYWYWLKDIIAR